MNRLLARARAGLRWLAWRTLQRRAYPEAGAHGVMLHLGCGRIDAPGFINIDAVPRRHVHHVGSIARLTAFADDSADFVYVSHALEHFGHRQVPAVLTEWYRVLKPGGRLCLSVPDFELLLDIYRAEAGDVRSILHPLMGGQEYAYDYHHTAFTRAYLTDLLLQAGFKRVAPWQHGSDRLHAVDDWSGRSLRVGDRSFPVSLNLEATK